MSPLTENVLRGVALLIAVAAVVDPSLEVERPVRPVVSIHATADAEALAGRVEDRLSAAFTTVRGPAAHAAARVVVGDRLPVAADRASFVVVDDSRGTGVSIARIRVPRRAPRNARVPVDVDLRPSAGALVAAGPAGESGAGSASDEPDSGVAAGAVADTVVELRVDGFVADRQSVKVPRRIDAPNAVAATTLTFVPSVAGPHHVRVVVDGTWADAVVQVDDRPWRVVVHDPRPSWSSTFVRRALERDARFDLVARVRTSPRSVVASGAPPRLADLEALDDTDVIIVGAPDALDAEDVDALATFMRRRGGAVVALIDGEPGAVADLAGVPVWDERLAATPVPLVAGSGEEWLRASEVTVATPLPLGARVLASVAASSEPTSALDPVIWQLPVGAGRLVVGGALDAWRFRGASTSRFDEFWRTVVADAAAASPPAVEIRLEHAVGRPGEALPVIVTLRDIALGAESAGRPGSIRVAGDASDGGGADRSTGLRDDVGVQARVSARLEGGGRTWAVRLWPEAAGRFRGEVRLPEAPGVYRLFVEGGAALPAGDSGAGQSAGTIDVGGDTGEARADLFVLDDAVATVPADAGLLGAWAAAQGGSVFTASALDGLESALEAATGAESTTILLRPMRSPWWIVPLALVLGGEWWLRRRRGAR